MRRLFFRYINGNHIIWLRSTSSNTQVICNYCTAHRAGERRGLWFSGYRSLVWPCTNSAIAQLVRGYKWMVHIISFVFMHQSFVNNPSSEECRGIWLGLSPPVKYFTDRSKAVLLLWIFYVFVLSCVCYVLCASVYMCFLVTCWERADLLALVCGVFCEFVTFPLVSWVRCGTWLYRFLIFAPLLTFFVSVILGNYKWPPFCGGS